MLRPTFSKAGYQQDLEELQSLIQTNQIKSLAACIEMDLRISGRVRISFFATLSHINLTEPVPNISSN